MCEKFHQLVAVGRWFPPGTPVSSTKKLISSSFHRLDMTLAVAEALNPNKTPKKLFSLCLNIYSLDRCSFLLSTAIERFLFVELTISAKSCFFICGGPSDLLYCCSIGEKLLQPIISWCYI